MLTAPFGPGCYEIRRSDTAQLVCFGIGGHVAQRMTSLLPVPLGCGTRNNELKRKYIEENLPDIEYRTLPCATRNEAEQVEKMMKANAGAYKFPT
jgi:predicted solute-binding protein